MVSLVGEEAACWSLTSWSHCWVDEALVVWVEVLVSAYVVLKHHVLSVLRRYRLMVTGTFAVFWVRELPR